MYFAEHKFLGDTTPLPGVDESKEKKQFRLNNGLLVTYGDISAFAGDYFGYENPISSDAKDVTRMKLNFQRWFDLLALAPKAKDKAEALREALGPLNAQAEQILSTGGSAEQLASVYQKNPLDIWKLDEITKDTRWAPNGANFKLLLATNADHFAQEARLTYNAGHSLALDHAVKGDLDRALAINAFADHFLEDSFAAGHLRVPRAQLMEVGQKATFLSQLINAAANVMHEEDGALGVWVTSPSGEVWKAFGDSRLPGVGHSSRATTTNIAQCRKALSQSIREVVSAFESKSVINESEFSAWQHAPIMEAIAKDAENHLPLVKVDAGIVKYRAGGPQSKQYKEAGDPGDWVAFYAENYKYIDGQVRLIVKKFTGIQL